MHSLDESNLGEFKAGVSISLILPAWNESEGIVRAISEADSALRTVAESFEIIVVDDGSTDDTARIVERVAQTNRSIRLVRHPQNKGYGAALRTGFASAQKDLVVFTDADCQFDLTELDRFVLLGNCYDIVCGYRIDRKDSFLRCLYSRIYNQLVRILLRTEVRDVDCALKLFHREQVQKLAIGGHGFLVNSEILTQAKQQGLSIVEVGVTHRPRVEGQSTVSISHIPKVLRSLSRYWWNSVQFPPPVSTIDNVNLESGDSANNGWITNRRAGLMQWGLLLFAAVFILTNLGYPLIDRDETRYAEISREMVITGNWVLPQLNFQTYYDKPPLLYWLCASSFSLFGVTETAARLVPAFAALATLLSTMWFGSRIFGKRIGLLSGTVLISSLGFAFTSRYLLLDGLLTLFVSLSLFTAYESMRGDRLKLPWWIASAVCCSLALLTKGPLSLVLWLPPVFLFAWLSESYGKPRWWHYSLFGVIVSIIVSPWLIAVTKQDATFLTEFLITHNISRFAGGFHDRPIWYFIPVLLIAGHPWSFLTISYTKFLFGQKGEARYDRPPAVGFLFLWSAWCFVFFSVSRCKLPTYLLPAVPALALMMGHYLNHILINTSINRENWFARIWCARMAASATCIVGVCLVGFGVATGGVVSLTTYVWALLWTFLLVWTVILIRDGRHTKYAWSLSAVVATLLLTMLMHDAIPSYSRLRTFAGPTSPLVNVFRDKTRPAIATVSHEFSEIPFYLNRSDVQHFANIGDEGLLRFANTHEKLLVVVTNDVELKQLSQLLPPETTTTIQHETGQVRVFEVTRKLPENRIAEEGKLGNVR